MSPEDKARNKAAKILGLKMKLIYIIIRLFAWGAIVLGTRIVKKCENIPLAAVQPPAAIVRTVEREKVH